MYYKEKDNGKNIVPSSKSIQKNVIQNKYKLLGVLGKGQFGTVCKGVILKTNELIAIKLESILAPVYTLKHESTILRHLSSKKVQRIPQIYYYGLQDPYMCLIMTYYHEGSLDQLSSEDIESWWHDACGTLRHIHECGIVHRDIKPAHFMKQNNHWHLIDFGMATTYWDPFGEHLEAEEERNTHLLGSPNWVSPYIHEGHDPFRRDDYISLVYIYFEMVLRLYGRHLPWIEKAYGSVTHVDSVVNRQMMRDKAWDPLVRFMYTHVTEDDTTTARCETIARLCSQLEYNAKPPYDSTLNLHTIIH